MSNESDGLEWYGSRVHKHNPRSIIANNRRAIRTAETTACHSFLDMNTYLPSEDFSFESVIIDRMRFVQT